MKLSARQLFYLIIREKLSILTICFLLMFAACGSDGGEDDGTGRVFWAQDSATEEYYQLRADLLAEGQRCNVYVEQGLDLSKYKLAASSPDEMAQSVADAYDNDIYQIMIDTFSVDGPIKDPKTKKTIGDNIMDFADYLSDGDGKLAILILDIRGGTDRFYVAGYFAPLNLFSNDPRDPILKYSNACDMIYINILSDPGTTESNMTLAHEMQHMMCFATDVHTRGFIRAGVLDWNSMDTWIDEGLASAAEYVYLASTVGGHNQERIDHFNDYKSPDTDIPDGNNFYVWGERADYILDEYATVYLFFQWLRLQSSLPNGSLNNYNIYKAIIGSKSYDQAAVVKALANKGNYLGETLNWETVLLDWFAANLLTFSDPATTYVGTLGKTPKHGYMEDPALSNLMPAVWTAKAGNSSAKAVTLYPGEGMYSTTDAKSITDSGGNISYYNSLYGKGLSIKYAGVNIDLFNPDNYIHGDGTVSDAKTYLDGVLLTYNINASIKGSQETGHVVANIVSTNTNFSLMKQPAYSAKAMTSSNQAKTSSSQTTATKPKKPHVISMGDMLRMNGHKDSGYDIKKFRMVK